MPHVVLCDYIPLQSGSGVFVALSGHRPKVWHKLLLNRDACAHVFRFVRDVPGLKKQVPNVLQRFRYNFRRDLPLSAVGKSGWKQPPELLFINL
jgi:hypothetical protein